MNKTELKLDYKTCSIQKSGIPVIVVAAGASSRMQGTNKQLCLLGGIPVLARTLLAFERSEDVSRIILVVREDALLEIQLLCEKYMLTKLTDIVCGGKTRQDSVLKGLSRLEDREKQLLIHDGARPLVDLEIIRRVAKGLNEHTAVTCAVKVKDTVKQVDESGRVLKTLKRDSLVTVQTPQGVRLPEYLTATQKADVSLFTDDTSIMEAAGFEVYTVEGSYKNIKITTPEDIAVAEGYLSGEAEE